jgi:hypothetical protein
VKAISRTFQYSCENRRDLCRSDWSVSQLSSGESCVLLSCQNETHFLLSLSAASSGFCLPSQSKCNYRVTFFDDTVRHSE